MSSPAQLTIGRQARRPHPSEPLRAHLPRQSHGLHDPSWQLGLKLHDVGSPLTALMWPRAAPPARQPSPLTPTPRRLQHKLALLQQQCDEKQQLFQAVQSELQIYEALHGTSRKGLRGPCAPSPHPAGFPPLLGIPVRSLPWELWRSGKAAELLSQKNPQPGLGYPIKGGELSYTKPRVR